MYKAKIQEKEVVKRLNSQVLLSWHYLQEKEQSWPSFRPFNSFILISFERLLFYRGGCQIYSWQSPSKLLRREDVDREWTVKSSDVSQPASYRGPLLFMQPEKQNFLLCQRSLVSMLADPLFRACLLAWSCPIKHIQLLHHRGLSRSELLLCQVHSVAQDRGLAVVHTGLDSHWKRLYGRKVGSFSLNIKLVVPLLKAVSVGRCPEVNETLL